MKRIKLNHNEQLEELSKLKEKIDELLVTRCADKSEYEFSVKIGADLYKLYCDTLAPDGYRRYMRFDPLNLNGEYAVLWGQYSYGKLPNNTDGRTYGTIEYLMKFFAAWLIDFVSIGNLPKHPDMA